MSILAGDGAGITSGGGGTIGGTGDITGVITGGTVDRICGAGVPHGPGSPGGTGDTGGALNSTGCRYLTLKSGPHVSGPFASPASGVAAMIGTLSTSQVTSSVLIDGPDNVTTFTQSRGWLRALLW